MEGPPKGVPLWPFRAQLIRHGTTHQTLHTWKYPHTIVPRLVISMRSINLPVVLVAPLSDPNHSCAKHLRWLSLLSHPLIGQAARLVPLCCTSFPAVNLISTTSRTAHTNPVKGLRPLPVVSWGLPTSPQ